MHIQIYILYELLNKKKGNTEEEQTQTQTNKNTHTHIHTQTNKRRRKRRKRRFLSPSLASDSRRAAGPPHQGSKGSEGLRDFYWE
jgi:hypothetical protein